MVLYISRWLIIEALNELCENIGGSLGQLEIYITSTLASEGSIQFENILNIPRLYRRTNREVSALTFMFVNQIVTIRMTTEIRQT